MIVQPCFSKPPSPGEKPGSQAHSQPISILPFYITVILPHTSPCLVCAFFACVFGSHFLVAHMFPCYFLVLAHPCHTFPANHCSCILRMLRPLAASLAIDWWYSIVCCFLHVVACGVHAPYSPPRSSPLRLLGLLHLIIIPLCMALRFRGFIFAQLLDHCHNDVLLW